MRLITQHDFQDILCLSWSKYKIQMNTIDILIFINEIKKCQDLFPSFNFTSLVCV